MAITITNNESLIEQEGWDFPLDEILYLLEVHNGETFVLIGDRLHEAKR